MIVFDASVLLLLLAPDSSPPNDPATGQPIERCRDRIEHLIATFERERQRVIIPTPVLGEVLVRAGTAGPAYLEMLGTSARFRIVPFDVRAAVELAQLTRDAIESGDKKGGSTAPWAKVKFDRQIIAIARVEDAAIIYSDDEEIARIGRRLGIEVIGVGDIPLPPFSTQAELFDRPAD